MTIDQILRFYWFARKLPLLQCWNVLNYQYQGPEQPGRVKRFRVPFLEWSQSWLISPHDFAGLFPVWGLIYTVKHRKPCDVLRHDLQSGILTTEHEQHEMRRRTHTQWPWNSVLNLHQTIKLAPRNHVIKYHSMRQLKLAVSLGSPPPRSARWLLGWLAAFGAKERLPRPPGALDLEPQFWGTAKVLILILMASVHRDLVWNLCLGPLGWVEHPSTKWRSLWWTWWKSLWLWSPSVCLCWAGSRKGRGISAISGGSRGSVASQSISSGNGSFASSPRRPKQAPVYDINSTVVLQTLLSTTSRISMAW